jgi:hypothetical protein
MEEEVELMSIESELPLVRKRFATISGRQVGGDGFWGILLADPGFTAVFWNARIWLESGILTPVHDKWSWEPGTG